MGSRKLGTETGPQAEGTGVTGAGTLGFAAPFSPSAPDLGFVPPLGGLFGAFGCALGLGGCGRRAGAGARALGGACGCVVVGGSSGTVVVVAGSDVAVCAAAP